MSERGLAGCAAVVLALAVGPAAAAAEALAWRADEPRAFGWHLGDVITRRIAIDVPDGWVLDTASLPARGRGGALELRQVRVAASSEGLSLELDYQVFLAPAQPRRIDLPSVALRFDPVSAAAAAAAAPAAAQEVRVQPWPVMIGPLVGEDTPSGRGFGELRPDQPAPVLDVEGPRRGLRAAALAALLAAAALVLRPSVETWLWRRRRPFARAARTVEAALRRGGGAGLDDAFRALHAAFNAHAARVLLREDARAWAAREPAWQALGERIDTFFAASREHFFAAERGSDAPAFGAADLRRLARDLQEAERMHGAMAATTAARPNAAGAREAA